jgi:hypothetical protein
MTTIRMVDPAAVSGKVRKTLEILGVVDHYTTLNTLSEAMQIEPDIRPPA